MSPLLQVCTLSKSFKQPDGQMLPVLDGIDFDLLAGEVVCLLGASGSGKTTLLKMLSGLDADYQGSISSAFERPGRCIGYLSQNEHLLPWRDATDNVALGLELIGHNKSDARLNAVAALNDVGLGAFAKHYPSQLSGGMKQRVLLARTLALTPTLLLLDEPMSNLDILARRELSLLIRKYTGQQKAATLVVTHSVEEACVLADRILIVSRRPGRLFKELRLIDGSTSQAGALVRDKAMDVVMENLCHALDGAA